MHPPGDTASVTARHLDAYVRGDVAALAADYAPDAVLVTATGGLRGVAAISGMFTYLFANLLPPAESTVKIGKIVIEGDVALVEWVAHSPYLRVPAGYDTLVVQGGKIVAQTGAGEFIIVDQASA